MSDSSKPRTVFGSTSAFLYALLGSLSLVHFVFLVVLAQYVSTLSVMLFAAAMLLFIPLTRRILAKLPLLGRAWIRVPLFLFLILYAHVLLDRGDYAQIVHVDRAFANATIITGQRDADVIERGTILVDSEGKIVAVGSADSIQIPDDFETVDLEGKTLMPGLINAHGHLLMRGRDPDVSMDMNSFAIPAWMLDTLVSFLGTYPGKRIVVFVMERNTRDAVRAGVTTLRSVGDPHYYDVAVRKRLESGRTIGPRLLVSGPLLCVTGGHAHQIGLIIDSPDEARRAVRASLRHGVDVIKIASTGGVSDSRRLGEAGELQMTPEEISAVVEEAHRKRILVTSHAESAAGVKEALRAGVDNIEHGAELDDEAIALFKNNPRSLRGYTTLHPTLSVISGGLELTDAVRENPAAYIMFQNGAQVKKAMISGYKRAVAGGIKLGVGTDAGLVLHSHVWKEMKYLVAHGGISNAEAIHIGTLGTAESIGVDEITGSVEAGKYADFVVLDGNPIDDLTVLAKPSLVVARGVVIEP